MEVLQEMHGDILLISLNGRLDTTNFNDVEETMNISIDHSNYKVLVDCTKMDYISSSGLRVLMVTLKKINAQGGKFVICGLQDTIKEIFDISGFATIFTIADDKESGLAMF